jgi:cbb3-type cytochrome oxidase subunit 3
MKIVLVIFTSLLVFNIFNLVTTPSPVMAAANAKTKFKQGLKTTGEAIGYNKIGWSEKSLPEIIGLIIKIFLSFLGVIFLVLIIYGGYIWMLARGNEQQVAQAKNIIEQAIIGLIIVLAAYAITALIGGQIVDKTIQKQ